MSSWTRFCHAAPPRAGWYWVIWEQGDAARLVYLWRVADEPQDPPSIDEVHRWVWGDSPTDDPESIALDVADPMGIRWSPGAGGGQK